MSHGIDKVLLPKYIKVPVGSSLTSVINGFENRGFPHCGGATDSSHIPIEAPQKTPADYYNRKGCHSVVLSVPPVYNQLGVCPVGIDCMAAELYKLWMLH